MVGWRLVHRGTGLMVPARCGRLACGWCGRLNAHVRAGAIGLAAPERMVTLTQVGDDWQAVRTRVRQLAWRVRRDGVALEWCWHVEPNPRGTGHHVHAWQHGDFIPQPRLSVLARGVGMGEVVDVRRWHGGSAGYGLKLAGVGYGLKGTDGEEAMRLYLGLNGKRLTHATRGFWRTPEGKGLPGVKAAEKEARRRAGALLPGPWVLEREPSPQ